MANLNNPADHGGRWGTEKKAFGVGTFVLEADGLTVVTDADIPVEARVITQPIDNAAGLLIHTKTVRVATGTQGQFTMLVSATGAGAPAGTETFAYMWAAE